MTDENLSLDPEVSYLRHWTGSRRCGVSMRRQFGLQMQNIQTIAKVLVLH